MKKSSGFVNNQLYWEPFWPNFVDVLKRNFRDFKVRSNVAVGIPIVFISVRLFWLGSSLAWEKHGKQVLFLIIAAELLAPFVEGVWTVLSSLWEVCHKDRFLYVSRDMFKVVVIEGFLILVWVFAFWHYVYFHASHFKVTVSQEAFVVSNVAEYRPLPAGSVFFPSLTLSNKYAPVVPTNWRLVATFLDGDSVTGEPLLGNSIINQRMFPRRSSIYVYAEQFSAVGGIGNGNMIDGWAEFVFKGVTEETLLAPGTKYKIMFEGLHETVETPVSLPLKEVEFQ